MIPTNIVLTGIFTLREVSIAPPLECVVSHGRVDVSLNVFVLVFFFALLFLAGGRVGMHGGRAKSKLLLLRGGWWREAGFGQHIAVRGPFPFVTALATQSTSNKLAA